MRKKGIVVGMVAILVIALGIWSLRYVSNIDNLEIYEPEKQRISTVEDLNEIEVLSQVFLGEIDEYTSEVRKIIQERVSEITLGDLVTIHENLINQRLSVLKPENRKGEERYFKTTLSLVEKVSDVLGSETKLKEVDAQALSNAFARALDVEREDLSTYGRLEEKYYFVNNLENTTDRGEIISKTTITPLEEIPFEDKLFPAARTYDSDEAYEDEYTGYNTDEIIFEDLSQVERIGARTWNSWLMISYLSEQNSLVSTSDSLIIDKTLALLTFHFSEAEVRTGIYGTESI
jgi:hypothetical protein